MLSLSLGNCWLLAILCFLVPSSSESERHHEVCHRQAHAPLDQPCRSRQYLRIFAEPKKPKAMRRVHQVDSLSGCAPASHQEHCFSDCLRSPFSCPDELVLSGSSLSRVTRSPFGGGDTKTGARGSSLVKSGPGRYPDGIGGSRLVAEVPLRQGRSRLP